MILSVYTQLGYTPLFQNIVVIIGGVFLFSESLMRTLSCGIYYILKTIVFKLYEGILENIPNLYIFKSMFVNFFSTFTLWTIKLIILRNII